MWQLMLLVRGVSEADGGSVGKGASGLNQGKFRNVSESQNFTDRTAAR